MGIGGHVDLVIDFVLPIEVGDALGDRVLLIDEIDTDIAFVPDGLLVTVPTPGTALNFFGPFPLVAGDDAVMDHDQATATAKELLGIGAIIAFNLHAVGGEDDEDIGILELGGGWEFHGTVCLDTTFFQQLGAVGEEARVVMLIRAVSLDSGTNENPQGSGVESEDQEQPG